MNRTIKWVLGGVLALVVLATGGTWAYIQFIREDAPDRLTLDAASTGTTAAGSADAAPAELDGTWRVTSGSQAGYRVDEILFGQNATAVGRTTDVTGEFVLDGTTVSSGDFTVDMTTVTSDENRRDNQFRGRIMDVASHPTSTFRLTSPIDLGDLPADGQQVEVPATGDLTLRGTTKRVTISLQAQRSGANVRVQGSVPVVFEEWGIPNPSFGPVTTEDRGELEFLLVFAKA